MTENTRNAAKSFKACGRMTLTIQGVEYAFRWIPAGSFLMGSPLSEEKRSPREVQHKVNISHGFWILETPVTQGMWKPVMGDNPSYFRGSERLPVERVSWRDCRTFTKKLNGYGVCPDCYKFSLPTEAEWEYACRAGTTTPYWFGSTLNGSQANCDGVHPYGTDERGAYLCETTEVGKYPANGWGLYDLHGNVWEWCLDVFRDYPTVEETDPIRLGKGRYPHIMPRVVRGGGWNLGAVYCRSAFRIWSFPGDRYGNVGARLVLRPFV